MMVMSLHGALKARLGGKERPGRSLTCAWDSRAWEKHVDGVGVSRDLAQPAAGAGVVVKGWWGWRHRQ